MENEIKTWVGCDLDGVLAEYDGWSGPDHIGAVVPRMKERVLAWIEEGKLVKIFTARASIEGQVQKIQDWLEANGMPRLEVTNVKDMGMVEFYDDRCTRIIMNTGIIFNEDKLADIQVEVQKERQRCAMERAERDAPKVPKCEPYQDAPNPSQYSQQAEQWRRLREAQLKRGREMGATEKMKEENFRVAQSELERLKQEMERMFEMIQDKDKPF